MAKETTEKTKPEEKTFTTEDVIGLLADPLSFFTAPGEAVKVAGEYAAAPLKEAYDNLSDEQKSVLKDAAMSIADPLSLTGVPLVRGMASAHKLKEAKKVDVKPERLHGSLRGEYEEVLQGAPKKQNVGKALSDKSLEDLQNGRAALQSNIERLQSILGSDVSRESRQKYGTELEANFKLLDRIEKEIGVKEMDVEESTDLDADLR